MTDLTCSDYSNFDDIEHFAVAISGSIEQRHVGLIINTGTNHRMLHLGWHNRLALENVKNELESPQNYCWSECDSLDPLVKESFSDWLLAVWEVNKDSQIPYSIKYNLVSYIDPETHSYRYRSEGQGLTCATFVIECFSGFSINIVDKDSWEHRSEDKIWAEKIVKWLSHPKSAATANHVEIQRAEIDYAVRFRPEEVLSAAVNFIDTPMAFKESAQLGLQVISDMRSLGRLLT